MTKPKIRTYIKGGRFVQEEFIEADDMKEFYKLFKNGEPRGGFFATINHYEEWAFSELEKKGYDISNGISPIMGTYNAKGPYWVKSRFESAYKKGRINKEEMEQGLIIQANELKEFRAKGLMYEPYDRTSFIVDMLHAILVMKNEKNNLEGRLHSAFKAGDSFRKIKVYQDYGVVQNNISKKPRTEEINKIIDKLVVSNPDFKNKELWNLFIGKIGGIEKVIDGKLSCEYIKESDESTQKMTVKTFDNRLATVRKKLKTR